MKRVITFSCEPSSYPYDCVEDRVNHWLQQHPDVMLVSFTTNVAVEKGMVTFVITLVVEVQDAKK